MKTNSNLALTGRRWWHHWRFCVGLRFFVFCCHGERMSIYCALSWNRDGKDYMRMQYQTTAQHTARKLRFSQAAHKCSIYTFALESFCNLKCYLNKVDYIIIIRLITQIWNSNTWPHFCLQLCSCISNLS